MVVTTGARVSVVGAAVLVSGDVSGDVVVSVKRDNSVICSLMIISPLYNRRKKSGEAELDESCIQRTS